jgi:hypothetical protein
MTNLGSTLRNLQVVLVSSHLILWINVDMQLDDPGEMFTMIFGGEAFMDWYPVWRDNF